MDELESDSSSNSNQDCNSSFQSMRLSSNQLQNSQEIDGFQSIEELPHIPSMPEKSLGQSVRQTYKMCCSEIRTMKTNLAYNIRHSPLDIFTKRQKIVLNKDQPITLLGKVYQNTCKDKQKFYTDFNNVIWLTYRSGIYGVESDAGWGCMIRVCQMVLAQAFKRLVPKTPLNQIINHFRDTPEAYFSLTRICQKGNIKERWTSSIEIISLMRGLLQKFTDIPLSIDLHSSQVQISSMKELDAVQYPLILFVSNRLGKQMIGKEYKDHLLDLMKIPYFIGVVGGNGGEALYLIGNYSQKIIFMDPHYVQSYEEQDNSKKTSTYFQSQPYSLEVQSLSPSLAVSFLVKSKQEYQALLRELYELQTKHKPCICFEIVSEQIKQRARPQIHKDDVFEVIS